MLCDHKEPKYNVAVFSETWIRINKLKKPAETMEDAIKRALDLYEKSGGDSC
jgi:hypothetical protein